VRKASHRGRCATISLIIACSRRAYVLLFFAHIPFVVNYTINVTPPERLQQHPLLFTTNRTDRTFFVQFFFKENVRYPIWICMDPICLILGTRFYLILGTRFEILGTRFGSLKRLKKNCLCVKAATGTSLTSCSQRRFVAIGNPERHVRKASHRGRCVAISLIIACSRYAYVLLFFAHI